jgi:SAM-dependent methyltransferase
LSAILIESVEADDILSLAVVGGSSTEPELLALQNRFPKLNYKLYGVENAEGNKNFEYLDLNAENDIRANYDLVICNQVIEHVWNFDQAFRTLRNLARTGGLVWVNCPASNMAHGSPEYYSAGYPPEMLIRKADNLNIACLKAGSLGSERLYFFTHALKYWPNEFELRHPVISFRPLRSYGKKVVSKSFFALLGRIYALSFSNKISTRIEFATETYFLGKVINK